MSAKEEAIPVFNPHTGSKLAEAWAKGFAQESLGGDLTEERKAVWLEGRQAQFAHTLRLRQLDVLSTLMTCPQRHGEDWDDPEHEIDDLGDLFRAAWHIMTPSQRSELLATEEVQHVLKCGGDLDPQALIEELEAHSAEMKNTLLESGYWFGRSDGLWVFVAPSGHTSHESSRKHEEDAIADAYAYFLEGMRG